MNRYIQVPYEAASPKVKSIYDETMTEMGIPFVLNWFKCQGVMLFDNELIEVK